MLNRISAGLSGGLLGKNFHKALHWIPAAFGSHPDSMPIRRAVMALVRTVLGTDRPLTAADIEAVRSLFRNHSRQEADLMIELLHDAEPITVADAAMEFAVLPPVEQRRTLSALIILAVRCRRLKQNQALFQELAAAFEISEDELNAIIEEQIKLNAQRNRIIQSGAGIVVALIVILVFILTATLLRSVIFGLIAAFIMLPVEKYFERRLSDPKSLISGFFLLFSKLFSPLRKLSATLRRAADTDGESVPDAKAMERTRITRAVSLTCVLLLVIAGAVLVVLGTLSFGYVTDFKDKHRAEISAAAKAISEQQKEIAADMAVDADPHQLPSESNQTTSQAMERFFAPVLQGLDNLRNRFDRMPLVQATLSELSRVLNDEAAQRELVKMFLKRTGGIFSFTASVVGGICNLLLDVLLTIFFFLLFLTKIAEFCSGNAGAGRQSEYLVRTVFNGNWLPGASEETISEAERIITEIITKLKIWMRGYFSLVLLDATVYTTIFYFLDVPYFFLLGPLAGCGILLPFIGPVASAVLTVLVTLAVGGSAASSLQILGIIAAYLIYNGIVEQFILYPVVIGESLGLTTLETIIVVLLGAIFAGIAGMILAIPAASVLKYLVPQIYKCLGRRGETVDQPLN